MIRSSRYAQAADPEKLNVCYSSIAATSITTWVPYEAGIYKKYGLDVRIIYVARMHASWGPVVVATAVAWMGALIAALLRGTGSRFMRPLVYLALSVALLIVTECASWFPARRATRIDPVIALRAE